jgi:lipoprotein-releasing system ATP-binding protein
MPITSGADIQLTQLVKTFKTGSGVPTPVLKGVDLHVAAGETLAITGASGSGKTTLLQIIGALDSADSGDVRVNGRELSTLDEQARSTFRNREIGFVFQAHILLPQLTALENVLGPLPGQKRRSISRAPTICSNASDSQTVSRTSPDNSPVASASASPLPVPSF